MESRVTLIILVLVATILDGCGGPSQQSTRNATPSIAENPLKVFDQKSDTTTQFSLRSESQSGSDRSLSTSGSDTYPPNWSKEWIAMKKKIIYELSQIQDKESRETEEILIDQFSHSSEEKIDGLGIFGVQYMSSGESAVVLQSFGCKSQCSTSLDHLLIFKYQNDCSERLGKCDDLHSPRECQDPDPDELTMEYILTKLINEFSSLQSLPICPKMYFISSSIEYKKLKGNQKTNFGILQRYFEKCETLKSRVRFIAEEKVGPSIAARFFKDVKIDTPPKDKFKYSVSIFLQLMKLLERLHRFGVIHGDIHSKNVAFRSNFGAHEDDLILIDLGLSRFFPDEIGTDFLANAEFYKHRTLSFLSIFELLNFRSGRRDDLFRAFEIFIHQLTFGHYYDWLDRVDENVSIACIKSHLPEILIATTKSTLSEQDEDEGLLMRLNCDEKITVSVPKFIFENFGAARNHFGEFKFNKIIEYLAVTAKYLRGDDIEGTKVHLKSPDSIPDYGWIIMHAELIMQELK